MTARAYWRGTGKKAAATALVLVVLATALPLLASAPTVPTWPFTTVTRPDFEASGQTVEAASPFDRTRTSVTQAEAEWLASNSYGGSARVLESHLVWLDDIHLAWVVSVVPDQPVLCRGCGPGSTDYLLALNTHHPGCASSMRRPATSSVDSPRPRSE